MSNGNKLTPVTITPSNYTNLTFNTKNSSSLHAPQMPQTSTSTNNDENNDIDKLKYELSLREKELHYKDRLILKEKQDKLTLQEENDFLKRALYNNQQQQQQQQSNLNTTSSNRACSSNDYARRRLHSTFQSSYIDPSDSQI
jgi:GTPase involved in cell partitioning and DNA repair